MTKGERIQESHERKKEREKRKKGEKKKRKLFGKLKHKRAMSTSFYLCNTGCTRLGLDFQKVKTRAVTLKADLKKSI